LQGFDILKKHEQTLKHLDNVLEIIVDLSPMDCCASLDEALKYYNELRPNNKVVRHEGYIMKLVNFGPLDRIL
jgi:hypothetical protein